MRAPGVVEQGQQEVIALAGGRRAVDLGEEVRKLRIGQVAEHRACGLLDGNRQHPLAHDRASGVALKDVAKEAVDRGQTGIARPDGIVPVRLQVGQKPQDQLGSQVLELECGDGSMGDVTRKPQEELERVAVGGDGVPADVSLGCEMADEEGRDEGREIGAHHDGLRSVMR
jgi:hypothetical protein